MNCDSNIFVYDRRLFSILDVFSQIGGIYNSLFTLGFLFCAAFSYRLMMASLIRKVFHFKPRFQRELKKPKKKKHKTPKKEPDAIDKAIQEKLGTDQLKGEFREKMGVNKANFNYKTTSILRSLICCLILRKRRSLRKDPNYRNTLYYLKGFDRLDKEMDLSHIILTIRKLKYMFKVFFEKD